jgi:WG containing repeat
MKILITCLICVVTLMHLQSQNSCSAYTGEITFTDTKINGQVFNNPQGKIDIHNTYVLPIEQIENITNELKQLRSLQEGLNRQQLSIAEQQKILKLKEEEIRIEREEIEKDRIGIAQEQEALQLSRQNFSDEINQVETEFDKTVASIPQISTSNSSSPIAIRIQELTIKGEQIIKSTQTCLNNDFQVVPIKDIATGKIIYGFSLDEIRKDPNYVLIDEYSEGYARVKRNNKFGFFDSNGNLMIDFKFDYAENFKNGVALVKYLKKWLLIDIKGKEITIFPKEVEDVTTLSKGTYKCSIGHDKFALFDSKANLISEIFYFIGKFDENGNAIVRQGGYINSFGVLNYHGKIVIPLNNSKIDYFASNKKLFVVEKGSLCGLFDMNGKEVADIKYKEIEPIKNHSVAICKKGSLYGLINSKGKLVLPCKYAEIGTFDTNGYALIRKNATPLYGIVNTSGEIVVDFLYHRIRDLQGSKYKIVTNEAGKSGVLDIENGLQLPMKYGSDTHNPGIYYINNFCLADNDFFYIDNGSFKTVTKLGKDISDKGDFDYYLMNGNYLFRNSSEISKLGSAIKIYKNKALHYNDSIFYLFNAKILRIGAFYSIEKIDENNLVKVRVTSRGYSNFYRLIDTTLSVFRSEEYNFIRLCKNGVYLVESSNKIGYLDKDGMLFIDCKYENGTQDFDTDDTAIVVIDEKFGVVNLNGLEFIPPAFDKIERTKEAFNVFIGDSIFSVSKQGKCISKNVEKYQQIIKQYHQKN